MIQRREFIALLGGAAAAWPLAARAQQAAKIPTIGYLGSGSKDSENFRLAAFLRGLLDTGFAEGQNVRLEYRWAENQSNRLLEFATDGLARLHDR
jgi:putative ABC transport system substrate-binding protein